MKFSILKFLEKKKIPTASMETKVPEVKLKPILLLPNSLNNFDPNLHITFDDLPETKHKVERHPRFERRIGFERQDLSSFEEINKRIIEELKKPLFTPEDFDMLKTPKTFYPVTLLD